MGHEMHPAGQARIAFDGPDGAVTIDNHVEGDEPGIADRRYEPVAMGHGYTLTHGAITSAKLNSLITEVSQRQGIPVQHELAGRDTGTDAMAAVFASIDSAATSIGFPIRNMHTISETGHTGDVDAAIHAIFETLRHFDAMNDGAGISRSDFQNGHPRLDQAVELLHRLAIQSPPS